MRDELQKAESYLIHPNVLVITGIRRCGKSIFSYLIERKHKFAYINFDDERLFGLNSGNLDSVLQAFYELYGEFDYLVLDEIQNVARWELFVNRLRRTKRIILTESNSNLLSGELATHITGRYIDKRLFPFSFKEYLEFMKFPISVAYTTSEKALIVRMLDDYFIGGSMPETYKFGKQILLRTYDDIITKDVVVRRKVKKSDELKRLAKYLITNVAEEFSYRALATATGIKNVTTVTKWVSYLEKCFLVFRLERFDFKLKQQFLAPKKIYCVDPGLVELIGFKFSENKGRSIENAVAIQLQRKKEEEIDLEVYYWKDYAQKEVDFVLKSKNTIIELIQIVPFCRIKKIDFIHNFRLYSQSCINP